MPDSNDIWRIACKVARWCVLVVFVIAMSPVLLFLAVGILFLAPKGRVWGTCWGTVFANAATGAWHKTFGPPWVRIHNPPSSGRGVRRRRFGRRRTQ